MRKRCLLNLTSAQESAQDFPLLELLQEDLNSSDYAKLTTTAETSLAKGSTQKSSKMLMNAIRNAGNEKKISPSTSSQLHPHVSRLAFKENDKAQPTSEIVSPQLLERSASGSAEGSAHQLNPDFSVLKMSQDSSAAHTSQATPQAHISETYSGVLTSAGMMRNGLLYQADTLAAPSLEKGYCWLESPGALSSGQGRPPGQSRLEGQLKKLKVLEKREVLNPRLLEKAYSLPLDWTNPQELKAATELLGIEGKPSETHSILEWPVLHSDESSTCPNCQSQIISRPPAKVLVNLSSG